MTVQRSLPPPPDFARPVNVPDPKQGEITLSVAARERVGRLIANRIIVNFRSWYEDVRRGYSEAK